MEPQKSLIQENNYKELEFEHAILVIVQWAILDSFLKERESILELFNKTGLTKEDLVDIFLAYKSNLKYGKIPEDVHHRLIQLYCLSSGHVQDCLHKMRLSSRSNLCEQINLTSNRFSISPKEFTDIITIMSDEGYCILPFSLSEQECDQIINYSHEFNYSCLLDNGEQVVRKMKNDMFDFEKDVVLARAFEEDIENMNMINQIIYDPVILGIVSILLGSKALLRHCSYWFTYPGKKTTKHQSEAAQLFHYDLDEFKWLKLFIFMDDVTDENGPHVYIPATHKPGNKPFDLLKFGYSRLPDNLVSQFHKKETWKKLTCKKGTMVLANTQCWHKGTPLTNGRRCVLVPEYSITTFSKVFL